MNNAVNKSKITEKVEEDKQKSLISEEKVLTGRVTFSVVLAYCQACTWYMTVFVLLFNVLSNVFAVVTNFWLADWSNAAGKLVIGDGNFSVEQITACDDAGSVE